MTSRLHVRDAAPDDADAVADIYAHHVETGTASFEDVAPDAAEIQRRMAAVAAMNGPYLVGEVDGRVRGFAYAGPFRARAAYRWTVEDSIYVAPDATGMGLGTLLLTRLIDVAARRGFRQMVAVIGGSDNRSSIRLHEKLGFAHAGMLTATGRKFDRWVDTVLMQRALGDGAQTAPDA